MNFILEEAIKLGADGVMFVPIGTKMSDIHSGRIKPHIDYTIKQLENLGAYPKSGRIYYKIVDGVKWGIK